MSQFSNTDDLRSRIISVADSCFAELGVRECSLSLIAERAGVELDDLKDQFHSKNILALTVQVKALEAVQKEYLANMPDASLEEAIKFIIRTRCEFVEKNVDRTALFFQNALKGVQPWSKMLDEAIWQLSVEFASLFEKSACKGEIKKGTDINVAVRALTSFYLTGIITMGLRAETFSVDAVWDFIEPQVDMLLSGVLT